MCRFGAACVRAAANKTKNFLVQQLVYLAAVLAGYVHVVVAAAAAAVSRSSWPIASHPGCLPFCHRPEWFPEKLYHK